MNYRYLGSANLRGGNIFPDLYRKADTKTHSRPSAGWIAVVAGRVWR